MKNITSFDCKLNYSKLVKNEDGQKDDDFIFEFKDSNLQFCLQNFSHLIITATIVHINSLLSHKQFSN